MACDPGSACQYKVVGCLKKATSEYRSCFLEERPNSDESRDNNALLDSSTIEHQRDDNSMLDPSAVEHQFFQLSGTIQSDLLSSYSHYLPPEI